MVRVRRLNHAVLYVRDAEVTAAFYMEAFGFTVAARRPGRSVFLRAAGSENHHDLGLFTVGPAAPSPAPGTVGLYHLAWEVGSIEELAQARSTLARLGAFVGESDHGASKSIYAVDPDGIELEVMWRVPREQWGVHADRATTMPLDLERELAIHGRSPEGSGGRGSGAGDPPEHRP